MPIRVGWYVPQAVQVMEPTGELSLNEYVQAMKLSYDMMEGCEEIYILSDQTHMTKQPPLAEMAKAKPHPSVQVIVVYGTESPTLQFGSTVTLHALGLEQRLERNLDDALDYLVKRKPEWAEALKQAQIEWVGSFDDSGERSPASS